VTGAARVEPLASATPRGRAATGARPYLSPYLAGVGIGVVLLLAFVIAGRGLGASGALSTVVAAGVSTVAPDHTSASVPYAAYLGDGTRSPLRDWLVFELLGVIAGGFLSAVVACRFRPGIDRGPRITDRGRLLYALGGGALMGVGAKLARGCTSGQALTGGALLSVGSWLFILTAFAAAYAVAPLLRKQWT
jgi:hypothetical protein